VLAKKSKGGVSLPFFYPEKIPASLNIVDFRTKRNRYMVKLKFTKTVGPNDPTTQTIRVRIVIGTGRKQQI
jgi:hypothetical protein